MRIVFAGTTTNAVDVLRYLVEQGRHEICAVVTREDAPVGRKQVLTESAVAAYAGTIGLPVLKANRIDSLVNAQIEATKPDLGLVIAYGALLKATTLEIPKHGWLNIHFSLLPKWRGAAPVQRSLMAGDSETGVTIFQLDEGMDTGPIHSQVAAHIEPDDNSATLLERLTHVSISMLDETLSQIDAAIAKPVAQTGASSHAAKLERSDAKIDWSKSAERIENLVRGAYPEPIAWANFEEQAIRILKARAYAGSPNEFEGQITGTTLLIDSRAVVKCGDELLQLIDVQPASKNVMSAVDWLRGKNGRAVLT